MNGKSTLLAFDTATEYCSVALAVGDNIYQRTEKLGNGHSEALLPWIDDLSKEAGISLQALDGIIFSAGPGSFTGLRIACGVAQGFAYGLDKKVLAASTLTAMAHHCRGRARRIAVLNDARMNECYAAIYETTESGFKTVMHEQLIKPEEVGEWIKENKVQFVLGTAIGVYEMDLSVDHEYASPEAAYMIDWYRDCRTELKDSWIDPDKAAPLYVRDHVALTINERLQGEKL